MGEVTRILEAIHQGDTNAAENLLPLVYDELRQLAAHRMARERPGQTLQPTALVHEAYLRLTQGAQGQHWEGRGHFFAAAGEAMRRILVESARRKRCRKHGGKLERVELEQVEIASPLPDDQLLAVDEALTHLAMLEPRAAEVVKLCFFVGLTQADAARELGVSRATAERLWSFARAWLFQQIDRPSEPQYRDRPQGS
jgi:RNA polymerase sigma factor (TIGR02999 family)